MYNLVEICSPFMPYGSSWTIGIRVGSRIDARGNTGLRYKWTSPS